jgi:CheY-like chemotaxis protein
VVDDNVAVREYLARLFEHIGCSTIQAANGAEAITLSTTPGIDAIVMDLAMPVMDGLTATRLIKRNALTRNIPIIALSGGGRDDDPALAIAEGCVKYYGKPVSANVIIAEVLHWVNAGRAR